MTILRIGQQAFSDGSATVGNQTEKERILDESIIEDQFDEFLSRLELLESEDNNGMDDEELDFSVKERVLMIKVEKAVFDPLLLSIRTSRPALYQAVLQHPLIAGQQKSNKKQSKKEKKRDRKNEMNKEKEKVLAQSRLTRSQRRDKSSFTVDSLGAVGTLADLRASPEKRAVSNREMMAAMVAKTVAEGSLSGYLVAIALLLQIMKDERSGTSFASAIPIGNILSGLFERPDGDDESDTSDVAGASSTQNSTGSTRESPYLANPFHSYLLSPRDEPAKSVAYSDMSRGDIGSVDETRTEDTASQVGCGEGSVGYPGPHSDAGSTVGSTRAEQGTETASVDEDGTDDEQLAQALAMSMRGTVVNTNADAITAFEANMRVKSYSANSSAASSSGSVSFTGDRSVPPLTQHNFPKIEPLSTFGPFSSPEYWRVLSSSDYPDHSGEIPMVSLRHTVIALLTVIRAGADSMLGDDFSLSLLAPPDHSGSIFEARHGPTAVYVSSTPAVNPSPLLFLLLELLLDSLLAELKDHCNSCPGEPCSLKKEMPYAVHTANTPLTQNLLKERERKGKQTLFATQATEKPLTEEEIEMREWAFQRYFLVWAISSVLRVLRASFSAAKEGRCSNASLGLNIAGEESAVESTADLESRVQKSTSFPSPGSSDFARPTLTPVLPLALRLLQHVEACVGLGLDDSPTAPSRSVNLDEVLSPSLDRDALCTKLLRYPTQNQSMKRKVASQGEPGSAPATRYAEQHSLSCYRHVIRLTAIDCCVSGLAVFRPQQADRDSLLFYLLSNTPKPEVSRQPDYGPEIFGLTGAGGNDIALTGCLTYFLQEMCLVSAHSLSKARAGPTSSSPRVSLGVKIEASTGGDPSIPSVLKSAVRKVLKKKFSDIDLETILLNRLKYANLVKVNHGEVTDQSSSSGEEQTQTFIAPKNLIFWGELQLLHALQKEYMKAFSQSTGGSIAYSPSQICFNVRRCHQDIAISGDSKVVTHRNSKVRVTPLPCPALISHVCSLYAFAVCLVIASMRLLRHTDTCLLSLPCPIVHVHMLLSTSIHCFSPLSTMYLSPLPFLLSPSPHPLLCVTTTAVGQHISSEELLPWVRDP